MARLILSLVLLYLLHGCLSSEIDNIMRKRLEDAAQGGWDEWGEWSSYSECPVNCGSGYIHRSRQRKCNNPSIGCVGDVLETELATCSSDECSDFLGEDEFGTIFQWSPCLPVCGNGIKIRAKGKCDPHTKNKCIDRRLHWEARNCIKHCSGNRRRKRWFSSHFGGSVSHSTDSSGGSSISASVNTPAGSFSGGVDYDSNGDITGGSAGYEKNVGIAHVGGSVSYSDKGGLSAGLHAGAEIGGVKVSGGGSYNFKDKSTTIGGSASAGGKSVGAKYNSDKGLSINTGQSVSGKRSKEMRNLIAVVDSVCEELDEGLFGHPENCKLYFACHKGVAYIETCPAGMTWDDSAKRCDSKTSEGCSVP